MQNLSLFTFILLVISIVQLEAQVDSILSKVSFEADFRFRIEQDWDSKKTDGSYRDDRTRLRYRLRTGATYKDGWYSLGFRIRTGDQNKQQDPQLTLGKGFKEFGTLPIGFEKIFFRGKIKKFNFWIGKNSFSFDKNNELFWSDNVFPEGIFLEKNFNFSDKAIEKISLKGGHYILSSNGKTILDDAYFQGIQTSIHFKDQCFKMFSAIYLLRNIAYIPDQINSFRLDYSIIHIGGAIKGSKTRQLFIDFDIYRNIEDYRLNNDILDELVGEKTGYSIGLQYGALRKAKDLEFNVTYTEMQKFSALDYMAQNDWARWDYSGSNSPDGRLTNFKGIELVAAYNITEKINLIVKYYNINQLISTGEFKETGQRIRLDLNVKM